MISPSDSVATAIRVLAEDARSAALSLATASTESKNAALLHLAELLEAPDTAAALAEANEKDLATARELGLSNAMQDRLRLSPERLRAMARGTREVAALPDPVGESLGSHSHEKGFTIDKVRVPMGVIGIIYESRPNVTIDCAALCLKSGNATILRGGSEAFHSNQALANLVSAALTGADLPANAVQLVPTTDRAALHTLLAADDCIDCIIPRGGEGLIRFVSENARMPVIKHYKGVCNIFLDTSADPAMAREIALNAKCQRPGVCNAAENLIVHEALLTTLFPAVARDLQAAGVTLRADEPAAAALAEAGLSAEAATEEDWSTEYLDLILAVKTVSGIEEAITFINTYGSRHSDAIVTGNEARARRFQSAVDSAAVYWNVSTRFTDGFEFGMGAEIGISTDKLHARGPMGLPELTSYHYRISGSGQLK